jgi:hypothetical protein
MSGDLALGITRAAARVKAARCATACRGVRRPRATQAAACAEERWVEAEARWFPPEREDDGRQLDPLPEGDAVDGGAMAEQAQAEGDRLP